MKVALIHDWLTGMRGGERCLEAFLHIYPEADIFTLVHVPGATSTLIDSRVRRVSFLNWIPGIRKLYRAFLPVYPLAVASFNLKGYDLVISLSHAAAKNVRVPDGIPHVCYCFTPMRYIWDQARAYLPGMTFILAQPFVQLLRWWDVRGARRVTQFVAISQFVAARIRSFYKRDALVIAPPVRMRSEVQHSLTPHEEAIFAKQTKPFFLCAGALVPYKRIDVAVEAFRRLGLQLWVVGGGPQEAVLKRGASSNVRFFGRVSEAFLWECYRRCEALVFPGIEDFGIVPVECLASGRPVIGIDAGGIRESAGGVKTDGRSDLVRINPYGVFIHKRAHGDPSALVEAVQAYLRIKAKFDPAVLIERARDFSYGTFFGAWDRLVPEGSYPHEGAHSSLEASNREDRRSRAQGERC
jgi:glycosyltransferase involved in cell wall biosynthesis